MEIDLSGCAWELTNDELLAENERLSRELKAALTRCAEMASHSPQRGEVRELRNEVRVLREQRNRVIRLHYERVGRGAGGLGYAYCFGCGESYPCPTVKALGASW